MLLEVCVIIVHVHVFSRSAWLTESFAAVTVSVASEHDCMDCKFSILYVLMFCLVKPCYMYASTKYRAPAPPTQRERKGLVRWVALARPAGM